MLKRPLETLVLGTQNPGKIQELDNLLRPYSFALQTLKDSLLAEPNETGVTFQDNALLKAAYYAKAFNQPTLADDSGLCIEALDQKPGVHTKNFIDDLGGAEKTFLHLNNILHDLPLTASMHCVLALAWPSGEYQLFEGICPGTLTFPARYGEGAKKGFGVDPIFIPQGHDKTLSEDPLYKAKHSHRTKALEKFLESLSS